MYTNKMYLNYFRFKYSINSNLDAVVKSLENFLKLVQKKRKTINYKTRNTKFLKIYAQNIADESLSHHYSSMRDCANDLKADRATIRKYIKNKKVILEKYGNFQLLINNLRIR